MEVGATPFVVGVLSTTHTRGLPRCGPGLHDTDCTTLRQLGGTGFGSLWSSLFKTVACEPRSIRPVDPRPTAWEWSRRHLDFARLWCSKTHTSGRATARRSGFRMVVADAFESRGVRAALFSPRAALDYGVGVGAAPFGAACDHGSSSSCPASPLPPRL